MKKKFAVITMAALMVTALFTACGGDTETDAPAPSSAAMPSADNNEQPAEADPAAGNMVSDETFAIIQQNYALMVEYHDIVAETYNSDEIAANAEIEEVMGKAVELIDQMGEIRQDMLTEEDAVTLNNYTMILILEELGEALGLTG